MGNKFKGDFKIYLSAYHNEVTGSRLLLVMQFPNGVTKRVLTDCGYFQEIQYRYLNYVDDIDPSNIDAILVTHNHIDHTGLLPKMVKNGYTGNIYMTSMTQRLLPGFLHDICDLQDENCNYIRMKYPDYAYLFNPLFDAKDVEKTLQHCVGKDYRQRFELFDDCNDISVAVTFYENGHILGASMILVECKYKFRKAVNFLFTGDYRLQNMFFTVPDLPERVKNMELIMIHEATYGTTTDLDIKKCFDRNLQEAFSNRQHVLIGAFAQGRMQEILYKLKLLQDAKLIPDEYEIIVDGNLGISTTSIYQSILREYNPDRADFLPIHTHITPKDRDSVLQRGHPVIVVTTSGMLSNGPARVYVPMFVERTNAMIHLCGYAAEETLARTLLESKYDDTITIGAVSYHKRATIRSTREMTSHITLDDMIAFINQFSKIRFLAVNHGSTSVKDSFIDYVADSCDNVYMTDVLDRKNMYCIYQFGRSGEKYSNMLIKKLPANIDYSLDPRDAFKKSLPKKKSKKKVSKNNGQKYNSSACRKKGYNRF